MNGAGDAHRPGNISDRYNHKSHWCSQQEINNIPDAKIGVQQRQMIVHTQLIHLGPAVKVHPNTTRDIGKLIAETIVGKRISVFAEGRIQHQVMRGKRPGQVQNDPLVNH